MPRRRGWVWRRGFGGGRGRSHGRRQADVDVDMERDVSPKGTNQTSTGVSWDSAPSSENDLLHPSSRTSSLSESSDSTITSLSVSGSASFQPSSEVSAHDEASPHQRSRFAKSNAPSPEDNHIMASIELDDDDSSSSSDDSDSYKPDDERPVFLNIPSTALVAQALRNWDVTLTFAVQSLSKLLAEPGDSRGVNSGASSSQLSAAHDTTGSSNANWQFVNQHGPPTTESSPAAATSRPTSQVPPKHLQSSTTASPRRNSSSTSTSVSASARRRRKGYAGRISMYARLQAALYPAAATAAASPSTSPVKKTDAWPIHLKPEIRFVLGHVKAAAAQFEAAVEAYAADVEAAGDALVSVRARNDSEATVPSRTEPDASMWLAGNVPLPYPWNLDGTADARTLTTGMGSEGDGGASTGGDYDDEVSTVHGNWGLDLDFDFDFDFDGPADSRSLTPSIGDEDEDEDESSDEDASGDDYSSTGNDDDGTSSSSIPYHGSHHHGSHRHHRDSHHRNSQHDIQVTQLLSDLRIHALTLAALRMRQAAAASVVEDLLPVAEVSQEGMRGLVEALGVEGGWVGEMLR